MKPVCFLRFQALETKYDVSGRYFLVISSPSCIFHVETSTVKAMESDIMTIDEVAEYLKLKVKTAYALAARGEIPGFKVGGSWRFRRSEIEKWIKRQSEKKA